MSKKDDKFHLDISSIQRPAPRRSKRLIKEEEKKKKKEVIEVFILVILVVYLFKFTYIYFL